jgi:hypothetical protein
VLVCQSYTGVQPHAGIGGLPRGYFPQFFAQIRSFELVFGLGLTDDLAGM